MTTRYISYIICAQCGHRNQVTSGPVGLEVPPSCLTYTAPKSLKNLKYLHVQFDCEACKGSYHFHVNSYVPPVKD